MIPTSSRCILGALAVALSLGLVGPTVAQSYPDKAIRVVVPFPPGGATDTLGRQLGQELSESLGVPIVIDNRGGAGGITGAEIAANADPDGYTLLLTTTSFVQLPTLHETLPFDPREDFEPLSEIARTHNLLVVPASSGITTFAEFVERMKAEPDQHSYGSYGAGSSAHIYGEMLKQQAGLDLTHIPYRGGGPLTTDILGELLSLGIVDNVSIRPHMESGRFNVIGVTGDARSALAPDAPTMRELGFEGFDTYGWVSVFAPKGVPESILDRLSAEFVDATAGPNMAELTDKLGLLRVGSDRQAIKAIVEHDLNLWAELVEQTGVTLE